MNTKSAAPKVEKKITHTIPVVDFRVRLTFMQPFATASAISNNGETHLPTGGHDRLNNAAAKLFSAKSDR